MCIEIMDIRVKDQTFRLLSQKAIFWKEEECLILSDLHLGKSRHFIRGGVPVPRKGDTENLRFLHALFQVIKPRQVLLLGDLFHSIHNDHVDEVAQFLKEYPDMRKRLVMGNHDIMDEGVYIDLGLETASEYLDWGPFHFRHDPFEHDEDISTEKYVISGHIHPGIRLRGKGRQAVTLPCFYFGNRQAILPAFGVFTGLYKVKPVEGDRVYAIAKRKRLEYIL